MLTSYRKFHTSGTGDYDIIYRIIASVNASFVSSMENRKNIILNNCLSFVSKK